MIATIENSVELMEIVSRLMAFQLKSVLEIAKTISTDIGENSIDNYDTLERKEPNTSKCYAKFNNKGFKILISNLVGNYVYYKYNRRENPLSTAVDLTVNRLIESGVLEMDEIENQKKLLDDFIKKENFCIKIDDKEIKIIESVDYLYYPIILVVHALQFNYIKKESSRSAQPNIHTFYYILCEYLMLCGTTKKDTIEILKVITETKTSQAVATKKKGETVRVVAAKAKKATVTKKAPTTKKKAPINKKKKPIVEEKSLSDKENEDPEIKEPEIEIKETEVEIKETETDEPEDETNVVEGEYESESTEEEYNF